MQIKFVVPDFSTKVYRVTLDDVDAISRGAIAHRCAAAFCKWKEAADFVQESASFELQISVGFEKFILYQVYTEIQVKITSIEEIVDGD